MMRQITAINWRYIGDAIPAFVTVMFIPFSYSTAYGLIASVSSISSCYSCYPLRYYEYESNCSSGVLIYLVLNGLIWAVKFLSRGKIVPGDADSREYWSCKLSTHSRVITSAAF